MRPLKAIVPALLSVALLPVAACGQTTVTTGTPGPAGSGAGSTPGSGRPSDLPLSTSAGPTSPAGTTGPTIGPTIGVEKGVTETVKATDVTLVAHLGVGFPQYPVGDGIRRLPGLAVEYSLVNPGRRSLAVHDRVPDDLGSSVLAKINPEHAWVYVHDRLVRVSKQGFDPAPNVNFFAAPVTGIRALPAGATVTGRAWVPSPPSLDVPGTDFAAPRAQIAMDVTTWQFCVQVGDYAERGGPVADSTSQPQLDALPAPASAPRDGELVCTDPVPLVTP